MRLTLTADEYQRLKLQREAHDKMKEALAECHIIIEHMNETLRDVHAPFEGVPKILSQIRELIGEKHA